jgi:hypothetical protein
MYNVVSPRHLQGYLNEFVFRFNHRFCPMVAFDTVFEDHCMSANNYASGFEQRDVRTSEKEG